MCSKLGAKRPHVPTGLPVVKDILIFRIIFRAFVKAGWTLQKYFEALRLSDF